MYARSTPTSSASPPSASSATSRTRPGRCPGRGRPPARLLDAPPLGDGTAGETPCTVSIRGHHRRAWRLGECRPAAELDRRRPQASASTIREAAVVAPPHLRLRTYRFLPVFWRDFWPRYDIGTPPDAQARCLFWPGSDWGSLSGGSGDCSLPRAPEAPQRADDVPLGASAIHTSPSSGTEPGWRKGDELVCLTEIAEGNLTGAGGGCGRRGIGARKREIGARPAPSPGRNPGRCPGLRKAGPQP